jgi:phage-related protein
MNLLDLAVKITCDDQASDKVEGIGSKIKSGLGTAVATAGKVVAAGAAAAATASVAIGKSALDSYASYEQLVGGVDKLYGSASDQLQLYAAQAYRTAGMSANQYMEQATSFSAAMIKSLDGDVEQAAYLTDIAMRGMSDNVNTFGSDMESVQNAFQGFAKENYTMLDNLNLGYAGTKEGMSQLIHDASQLTDVQAELGLTVDDGSMSFSNIVKAIQVMQTEMNIAGTTSREASDTIEGSINSMKAAWENWLTALGRGDEDVIFENSVNLIETVEDAASNVFQRVVIIAQSMGKVITDFIPILISDIKDRFMDLLPESMRGPFEESINVITEKFSGIVDKISSIGQSIHDNFVPLIEPAMGMASALGDVFTKVFSLIGDVVMNVLLPAFERAMPIVSQALGIIMKVMTSIYGTVSELISFLTPILTEILNFVVSIVMGIAENVMPVIQGIADFISSVMGVIQSIITIVLGIINGDWESVWSGIQSLVMNVWGVIQSVVSTAINAVLAVISSVLTVISSLWNSIWSAISTLIVGVWNTIVGAVSSGINNVVSFFVALPGQIWDAIVGAVNMVVQWGSDMVSRAQQAASNVVSSVVGTLTGLPGRVMEIGRNIVQGLWDGISGMAGWLTSQVTGFFGGVIDTVKGMFGIASPSKLFKQFGKFLDQGLSIGIAEDADLPVRSMEDMAQDIEGAADVKPSVSSNGGSGEGGSRLSKIIINIDKFVHSGSEDDDEKLLRRIATKANMELRSMGVAS